MSFVLSPPILRTLFSALNTLAVHFYLWTFLLLTTNPPASNCQPKVVLKLGVMVPVGENQPLGDEMTRTAAFAFKRMNDGCCGRGFELTYDIVYTRDSLGNTLRHILEMVVQGNTSALIGPSCDFVCQTAGVLVADLDIAMFSYECKSIIMADDNLFTTFVKTAGTYLEMGRFMAAILTSFNFTQGVVIVTSLQAFDIWFEVVDVLSSKFNYTLKSDARAFQTLASEKRSSQPNYELKLRSVPINIKRTHWSATLFNETIFEEELKEYVVENYVFLLCMSPGSVWDFLTMVKKLGFFKQGFAYIAIDYVNMGKRLLRNIDKQHDFTGLLDITIDFDPYSSSYSNLLDEIFDEDVVNDNQCRHYEYGLRAALMADAIELFTRSLGDCIKFSGECIKKYATDVSFQGVTGNVDILFDGSRYAGFMLHNLVNGCYVPVARSKFVPTTPFVFYETIKPITWPGYTTTPPKCPVTLCSNNDFDMFTAILYSVTTSVLVILILFCLVVRRRQTLDEMSRRDWIITSERLFAAPPFAGPKPSVFPSGVRAAGGQPGQRQGDATSVTSRESLRTMVTGQIYAKVTVLDQQLVAVKQVYREYVHLDANIITEINQVRSLKHTNINQLKGACIEAGNVCLVWGYCTKGSLRDVLQNENIRLDWMFKLSFVCDIAKGMGYLHGSPVNVHGRLKSTNVVVDMNWCCKITDLNMPHFRYDEKLPDMGPGDWRRFYNFLWTAPEILRNPMMARGTKKGDVYAFGIIMHEVVMRTQPFGLGEETDAEEVIHRVMNEENPPFRPLVPDSCMADNFNKISDEGVLDLMVMCWDEYPLFRLSFNTISSNLKNIRAAYGSAGNLVDQMLQMVTKYADNLEELVEERTQQLAEEQRKTEELLSRMLPKSVAHELKMGRAVIPESYQSVTIFFSDIVGFTALASRSTPMQVVTMLNELYTVFDNCVDKHDAYKIETIGDAYMLVSGLPVRNGDLHAGEIATAALDILCAVLSFTIPHCPGHQLSLRVGLHSGPTVAGVVGQKMPRFCLFGDTVNYAASMESSGLPMHIHVSPDCKAILDKLGGYHLKSRGTIEMKGKGKITTYFLKRKDDYSVNIPKLLPGVKEQVGIDIR